MFSHIYFVDGLLIDTGHSKVRQTVLEQVKDLEVKQIFLTHFHEDHSGNLGALQAHFDCPVYGSEQSAEIMKQPPPISFAQHLTWGDRPAFDSIIPQTGKISTLNYQFSLIPIPGHAPDMTALYEPNKQWLFSADLYVYHRIKYFLREESTLEQIRSIRRILELEFDALLCSHNPQFTGGKGLLEKKLRFLENFFAEVADLYQSSHNPKEIFRRMQLKESWQTKLLSHGHLSQMNMVKSVIRDIEREKQK